MKNYWVGIILFIFIAGCSSKGSTGGNSSTKQDVKAIFDIPADPIAVTITADADRQAEKAIPVEGGSLSVTASDGTFMADALLPVELELMDYELYVTTREDQRHNGGVSD